MLTRDEARAALVRAIELRPAGWVARELALSLARLEYRAGRRAAISEATARRAYLQAPRDGSEARL